jgi:hypothetical protein
MVTPLVGETTVSDHRSDPYILKASAARGGGSGAGSVFKQSKVGQDRHVLGPGEFAWVPRGTAHTFANASPHPARAITVATPGGLKNFFAEQAQYLASVGGEPDPAVLAGIVANRCAARFSPGRVKRGVEVGVVIQ